MIMSTIGSAGKPLSFYLEPKPDAHVWHFLTDLQTYWSAERCGLAAARTYHELTRQGAPHETAVERIFDQHLGGR
jgi:hypothetical protein